MKGDFSRDTFDQTRHFTRVLMQQGRVLLDSDWNEQAALLLHHLRALATDLIGPHGGPRGLCGFGVVTHDMLATSCGVETPETVGAHEVYPYPLKSNFLIGSGRYYVGGVLCENERMATYAPATAHQGYAQPDYAAVELEAGRSYLVYLDAWEQHVSALEDETIREVALGAHGPDTASRARVVWQVKTLDLTREKYDFEPLSCESVMRSEAWGSLLARWQPENRGMLRAKAEEAEDPDSYEPCLISPDARYRGAENQLYRIEIHRGGRAGAATFKWSRDNGAVVLPISTVSGSQVTLERMGRDARSGVQVGDWVEVYDGSAARRERPVPLLQVTEVDPIEMIVTLSGEPHNTPDAEGLPPERMRNPLLRRWDQKAGDPRGRGLELRDGAAIIKEGRGNAEWLELEDGVLIQFEPNGDYRAGDYWLIPARTETGDVEWPGEVGRPAPRPPHGITHYYAPLALIEVAAGGTVGVTRDYRRTFGPLASCPS